MQRPRLACGLGEIERGGAEQHRRADRAGLDQVLRAQHIGLDALEGVVLGGGHDLGGGGVHHDIDVVQRAVQALAVAHVADEEAQARVLRRREHLGHLELLEFVAREDDDLLRVAVDDEGRPTKVPALEPRTPDERRRFAEAEVRRAMRREMERKFAEVHGGE